LLELVRRVHAFLAARRTGAAQGQAASNFWAAEIFSSTVVNFLRGRTLLISNSFELFQSAFIGITPEPLISLGTSGVMIIAVESLFYFRRSRPRAIVVSFPAFDH